jgi:predicted RNase H-like nuclease (RuvC/YqgF family)
MKLEDVIKEIEELRNKIQDLESRMDKKDIEVCQLIKEVDDLKVKLNTIELNTQTIIEINNKQDTKLDNLLNKLIDSTIENKKIETTGEVENKKIETQGKVEIKKIKWDFWVKIFSAGGAGVIVIEVIKKLLGL